MFYIITAIAIYFITKIIIKDSKSIKVKYTTSIIYPKLKNNSYENVGIDLYVTQVKDCGQYYKIDTGTAIQPPEGYYFDVVPRSSIYKKGLILANSIGIIDQSYRGTIKAMFIKTPNCQPPVIGERLLQLIPRENLLVEFEEVSELDSSERGDKGFGSTGR